MPWLSDYDLWKTTPPWFYDDDPPETDYDEPEATDLDEWEDLTARTGILNAPSTEAVDAPLAADKGQPT